MYFFNILKPWLKKVEIETYYKLKFLKIDKRGKFISLALEKFCKSRKIIL